MCKEEVDGLEESNMMAGMDVSATQNHSAPRLFYKLDF
jgi:hypothetical protein